MARSWGSRFRLRDIAGTADGWFASGYNTDPARYAASRALLDAELRRAGSRGTTERDPSVEPAGTRKLARTTKLGRLPGGDHQPSCRTAAATSVRGTDGDCRRSGRVPRCAPHGDYHPRRASPLTLLPVEIDQDNTGPEATSRFGDASSAGSGAVSREHGGWQAGCVAVAVADRRRCYPPSVHSWSAVGRPLGGLGGGPLVGGGRSAVSPQAVGVFGFQALVRVGAVVDPGLTPTVTATKTARRVSRRHSSQPAMARNTGRYIHQRPMVLNVSIATTNHRCCSAKACRSSRAPSSALRSGGHVSSTRNNSSPKGTATKPSARPARMPRVHRNPGRLEPGAAATSEPCSETSCYPAEAALRGGGHGSRRRSAGSVEPQPKILAC